MIELRVAPYCENCPRFCAVTEVRTLSDVFQSFTESQKEAIYELTGDAVLNGKYDHGLYHRTQFGMSENQKDVMDFLIKMCLEEFKKKT